MSWFKCNNRNSSEEHEDMLDNIKKINRRYFQVGVYGEGLSPDELERRIVRAVADMEELIAEVESEGVEL